MFYSFGFRGAALLGVVLLAGCAGEEVREAREAERQAQAIEAQEGAVAEQLRAQRRYDEERAEAERQAQLEAERAARAEAERQAQLEAERAARAEAERQAQLEAERQAIAAAQRDTQLEAERRARLEAERQAQAQAEREARAQAEQMARQQAEREVAEQSSRQVPQSSQAPVAIGADSAAAERRAAAARDQQRAEQVAAGAKASYGRDRPTEAEITRLGQELTPVGAVRAGNPEGTIPAWTGGITSPPSGYQRGDHHPDPFAQDRSQFTITPANYRQYQDKLSPGQLAMFERYPSYAMPVYQTRRSASFPQRIYEMTIRNARTARLTEDGEGVLDAAEGFPFPIPKNGPHLIWNHKMKYKGVGQVRYNNQAAPTPGGAYTMIRLREELLGLYWEQGNTIEDINNVLLYFYQLVEGPARLAGNVLLVHETLNQVDQFRQAWIYNPGQRRVRRAPNVAYDNPGTASDGLRTNDMTDMFNGALDRYAWRLVGKQEMYVPYNSYRAHSDQVRYDDLVRAGHLNPELMRYELHRVWIVEARLKEGLRHIHPRRVFYLDEDSYQILLTEHYDPRGDLWRFSEAHSINYYEVPTFWSTIEVHHDLQSGRYIAVGLDNQDPVNDFTFQANPADFNPQSLRKRGRR